jgi:hypothetical protein
MRGRFTDSIASTEGWSYAAGTEVLVAGTAFHVDAVPETIGRQWIGSGLLEPVESVNVATSLRPETATSTSPRRTQERGASRR